MEKSIIQPSWPATFAEMEEAQLKTWLGETAQRLAMAEELFWLKKSN